MLVTRPRFCRSTRMGPTPDTYLVYLVTFDPCEGPSPETHGGRDQSGEGTGTLLLSVGCLRKVTFTVGPGE